VQVSVDRVDGGEDQVHREVVLQDGVGEDRVQNRGRVSQARRLDDYAVQPRYLTPLVQAEKLQQCSDEVLSGGAADTPAPEKDRALVDPPKKMVV
jgi:hypothetical protein